MNTKGQIQVCIRLEAAVG